MRLRVIPLELGTLPMHLVAVCLNHALEEIDILPYTKNDSPIKLDLAPDLGDGRTVPDQHQVRMTNGREGLRETVNQVFVCLEIGEHLMRH